MSRQSTPAPVRAPGLLREPRPTAHVLLFVIFLVAFVGFAGTALGQSTVRRLPRPAEPRIYLAADGVYQALYDPFTRRSTFSTFGETRTLTAVYSVAKPPAMLGTVVFRVWKAVGVGAAVSRASSTTDATVEGNIPHPFFFDRPRAIEGNASGLGRQEMGLHLQMRVVVPVRPNVALSLFAGPSLWQVTQDRVGDITFASSYPFDTARFTGAVVEEYRASTWGFNAGFDVATYFTRNVGVGALMQVATASAKDDGASANADTRIGGFRAGGGLRLRF
jgi:hypothetical protein